MSINFGSTDVKIKHKLTDVKIKHKLTELQTEEIQEVRSSKYKHLVQNFKQLMYKQIDHVSMAVNSRTNDYIRYHR
jgi:phosphoribosylformylglycinamidine (FGAM) synthase PurS component